MNRTKMNIRMDLLRVTNNAWDLSRPLDKKFAKTFIESALKEFEHIEGKEADLKNDLLNFKKKLETLTNDTKERQYWGEDILTVAMRLGTL